jgi:hypothetical protein
MLRTQGWNRINGVAGSVRMTSLRARGRRGVHGVAGSKRTMALWAWEQHGVDGVTDSRRTMGLQARGRREIGSVVSSGTTCARSTASPARGQGRWWHMRRAQLGSEKIAWGLRRGLNNGVGSEEVDDNLGSVELSAVIFGSLAV